MRPHRPSGDSVHAHVSGTPWVVRDFVPEDEACVVATWLKGYAHAREIGAIPSMREARIDAHPDEVFFWQVHQPIVTSLVSPSTVRVVCDPKRATYEPGAPAVIWAWACMTGSTVHWVMVKRSAMRAGLGEDIVRDLLGDRLEREQRTTFELVDLARLKLIPPQWKRDRGWLSTLRSMSMRMLDVEDDLEFSTVANRVLDVHRKAWVQSSDRSAA